MYKLLNGGWFWGLEAMIGEAMMKFSGSCTMRVSTIGTLFLFEIYLKKINQTLITPNLMIFDPEFIGSNLLEISYRIQPPFNISIELPIILTFIISPNDCIRSYHLNDFHGLLL